MRIATRWVPAIRSAMFLAAIAALFIVVSITLLASIGFGFTAGEIMVNPNARLEDNVRLEHAAHIGLGLFAAGQIVLVSVVLMSGFFKTRAHVAMRAFGGLFVSVVGSYLFVRLLLERGAAPVFSRTLSGRYPRGSNAPYSRKVEYSDG